MRPLPTSPIAPIRPVPPWVWLHQSLMADYNRRSNPLRQKNLWASFGSASLPST